MGEIIARTTCPVCGAPNQNLKINKNGNLYMYCDNRCSSRFNPKESRELIDELRQGRTVRKGGDYYTVSGRSNTGVGLGKIVIYGLVGLGFYWLFKKIGGK